MRTLNVLFQVLNRRCALYSEYENAGTSISSAMHQIVAKSVTSHTSQVKRMHFKCLLPATLVLMHEEYEVAFVARALYTCTCTHYHKHLHAALTQRALYECTCTRQY